MKITVTRERFGERLEFEHDAQAGVVSGADADSVHAMLRHWSGKGALYGTQPVDAPDPLRSLRDMAVMLASEHWDLPPELGELLPPAEEIPEGAIA